MLIPMQVKRKDCPQCNGVVGKGRDYLVCGDMALIVLPRVCLPSCIYLVVIYRKRTMLVLSHLQIYYHPVCFLNHEYLLH